MRKLTYPTAATVEQDDDYHGTVVADPYRWLEDLDSAATHAWVAAQNRVTYGFLESIPEREAYTERLTEIWDHVKYSAPFREGDRTFFFKNEGLQDQFVLYVQDGVDADPRVLLDPNELSEDGTVSLGGMSVSRDGRYLAWATSTSGSDWREWHVRDIETANDLEDVIKWSKFSDASWDRSSRGFYYSRYDAPREGDTYEGVNYYQKLYYHRVGTPQDDDCLVFERADEKEWGFGSTVTDDGHYLVISVWQGTSHNTRILYQDLRDKSASVHELWMENDADYSFLGNDGPVFFFKTDKDAPRKRIISIDLGHPDPSQWREVVPEATDILDSASILDNSLVLIYMHDVKHVVKIYALDGTFKSDIPLPGHGTVSGMTGHQGDAETYFTFVSYLIPSEIYHYSFREGESVRFRQTRIQFDFDAYTTEQDFYVSKDGTRVPMFLIHRKDLRMDGSHPTILYGYGGFNISLNPAFSVSLLPWLEQGGVYVVANLRGGGEYGEGWHEGGMLKNKQNVFDDFIAAAEHLIARRYTRPSRLAIYGGSNGGTLVGAVINQRPELFGAAMPAVGVMDMLRFQHFTIGWAWTSDYGSSEDVDMFPTLYAYSPYHNLRPGTRYPAVLVLTADHDDRVVPGHSFKYAARLQTCQAGDAPTMIRIQTKAGHGAGAPTSMVIQEVADRYAFLHKVLFMNDG